MARYHRIGDKVEAFEFDGSVESQRQIINAAQGYVTFGPNQSLYVTDKHGNKLTALAGDVVVKRDSDDWGVEAGAEFASHYELD